VLLKLVDDQEDHGTMVLASRARFIPTEAPSEADRLVDVGVAPSQSGTHALTSSGIDQALELFVEVGCRPVRAMTTRPKE
jgi:hypothetical protein